MSDDNPTADEKQLLDLFESMDEHARYAMVKFAQFLAERPKHLPLPTESESAEFLDKARQESEAQDVDQPSETRH